MTESERLRVALETHRDYLLERAERCERIAKACRAIADKDAATITRLRLVEHD